MIQKRPRERQNEPNEENNIETEIELTNALDVLKSSDFSDFEGITTAWDLTKDYRSKLVADIGAKQYFDNFPVLSSAFGHLLVS